MTQLYATISRYTIIDFIKPYKGGYLHVMGNGQVRFWSEEELKILSMAYDEIRFIKEDARRSFSLDGRPIETVMEAMKARRKYMEDYE